MSNNFGRIFQRGIVNFSSPFSLSLPSSILFWFFFTRLSSDSNPIEEKKKRRRGGNPAWIIDFPGREWERGEGEGEGACLRRLYSRSPATSGRNKAGNKCEYLRRGAEKGPAFRLKYHAKIYSNWFPRLIHYATVFSSPNKRLARIGALREIRGKTYLWTSTKLIKSNLLLLREKGLYRVTLIHIIIE